MKKQKSLQIILILLLLISAASFVLNLSRCIYEIEKEKSSISVIGDFAYEPYSYENFIYNPERKEEYGRFVMSGKLYIANHTAQGCILNSELQFPLYDNYCTVREIEVETESDKKYDIFYNGNPIQDLKLDGFESICVDCQVYIYLSAEAQNAVKEQFGEAAFDTEVREIMDYLYQNFPEETYYEPPRAAYPLKETNDAKGDECLDLVVYSNTGASDICYIDYKNKREFDAAENLLKTQRARMWIEVFARDLSKPHSLKK